MIAEAVRAVALGTADAEHAAQLEALGLAVDGVLSEEGEAVEDAFFITETPEEVEPLIASSYRRLPLVQALVQGLHGRGAVPLTGALHFLKRHRLAPVDADETAMRGVLATLNRLGLVAYSNKHQTVRVTTEAAYEGEPPPLVRVIEKDRPYSNVRHLREILRECREYIWWVEPHLDRKVLEPLTDEADGTMIQNIRILSGPDRIGKGTKKDFGRFKAEMVALGITVEWRVLPRGDVEFHDRYIVTEHKAWNVPPLNTLYQGKYSEAFSTTTRPPFDEWWGAASPLEDWPKD